MAILLRSTAEKYESRGSIASDRVSYIEIVDDVGSRFFQPRDCIDIRPARGPFPRSIFRCLVFDSFFSLFFFFFPLLQSVPPFEKNFQILPSIEVRFDEVRRISPRTSPIESPALARRNSPELARPRLGVFIESIGNFARLHVTDCRPIVDKGGLQLIGTLLPDRRTQPRLLASIAPVSVPWFLPTIHLCRVTRLFADPLPPPVILAFLIKHAFSSRLPVESGLSRIESSMNSTMNDHRTPFATQSEMSRERITKGGIIRE